MVQRLGRQAGIMSVVCQACWRTLGKSGRVPVPRLWRKRPPAGACRQKFASQVALGLYPEPAPRAAKDQRLKSRQRDKPWAASQASCWAWSTRGELEPSRAGTHHRSRTGKPKPLCSQPVKGRQQGCPASEDPNLGASQSQGPRPVLPS